MFRFILSQCKKRRPPEATPEAISKAESQLHESQCFFTSLMTAVQTLHSSSLPFCKVVVVPGECSPSPATKSSNGFYHIHKDLFPSFDAKWNEFVNDLLVQKASATYTPADFDRFTRFTVGVWSMQPTKHGFKFNVQQASLTEGLQGIDKQVEEQHLSADHTKHGKRPIPEKQKNKPNTDVSYIKK